MTLSFFQFFILSAAAQMVQSPNGKLSLTVSDSLLTVCHARQPVLSCKVGMKGATLATQLSFVRQFSTDYTMIGGKQRQCSNACNEYRMGALLVRLYNDGLAFRYELEGLRDAPAPTELTAYHIPEGTKRWMQQWTDSYEGFFPLTTTYKTLPTPSYSGTFKSAEGWNNRWGYPALLEPREGVFALITEANIERRQSASWLTNEGECYHVVPAENPLRLSGDWHSPWRLVVVGSLGDLVASTLVTDVSEPSQIADPSWIRPGIAAWVYWAYNHGSNDYDIIRQYTDMAVRLGLPYVLIDAEWDTMKGGKTVADAVAYARAQGVKPMIWYNSSVGWVDGAPTPKYRLNDPELREREFAWCERIGVAGVKIDFFSGDSQSNMDYCLDLLACAARHHLLVNFHGATIPRGWQRTWPNLLTTEGVYGAEWYNNVPTFTRRAASHNATLPFTRNVVGPMDYTPCAFSDSQHPHITTHAHELALTVVFESGLQHLADRPESFYVQPREVQRFLGELPAAWDETRLISGYPGESVVIARRHGDTWYVAGINGTDSTMTVATATGLDGVVAAEAYYDGDTQAAPWRICRLDSLPRTLTLKPRGGFVWKVITKKRGLTLQ